MDRILSIVIPAYCEERMIAKAHDTISKLMRQSEIEYEFVFVDDGSKDNTWEEICRISEKDPYVVGIHFSRNFGKESAIYAGMAQASGDAVVVMDCDLQHPPETVVEMYRLWMEGYEVVEGIKLDRGKESIFHKKSAGLFYRIMSRAVGIDMQNASDFKLMDRKVVEVLLSMPERNTFFRALSSWVGFKSAAVEFEVREREEGTSKWSFKSLFKYALSNITSFTSLPLHFVTVSGFVVFLAAVVMAVQTLIRYFSGNAVEGFSTVILLILFIGSMIMLSLGIIGYYLSKMYDELKHRPKYIISRISGSNRQRRAQKHEKAD